MRYKIESEYLKAEIDSSGGELQSLTNKSDGYEYLWQGNAEFWEGRSPLLFPIVGNLNNERYIFQGKEYAMSKHGFARKMVFGLHKSEVNALTFQISHDKSTLKQYPFKFILYLTYSLLGKAMKVEYRVENKSEGNMWFSIGGHPGFNCSLNADGRKNGRLVFNKKENVNYLVNQSGVLTGEERPLLSDENRLEISELDFDGKTKVYIMEGLKSDAVRLENSETNREIEVKFGEFPYLGIWSPKNCAPFVCIEPWYGITYTGGAEDILDRKRGIQKLGVGRYFECCYEIICH